jgi:hypothetical protein
VVDVEGTAPVAEEAAPAPAPDDWDDAGPPRRTVLIAQVSVVVLILVVVGVIALVRRGDDSPATKKPGGTTASGAKGGTPKSAAKAAIWPKSVGGRPASLGKRGQAAAKVKAKAKPGVYLWGDFDGWHLWVVGGAGVPARVHGTITTNSDIARAEPASPTSGTVKVDGMVATFDLPTGAAISGVDFNPGFFAKRMVFTIEGPTGPIDPKLVKVGSKGAVAPFPFVLDKAVGG